MAYVNVPVGPHSLTDATLDRVREVLAALLDPGFAGFRRPRVVRFAAHPDLPMHVYPAAGHGFSCDERGAYHAPSATLARTRTMEFLAKHL